MSWHVTEWAIYPSGHVQQFQNIPAFNDAGAERERTSMETGERDWKLVINEPDAFLCMNRGRGWTEMRPGAEACYLIFLRNKET